MSKGNVDKFLSLTQKDESLARKMAACLYKLETNDGKPEGLGDFITREIVPLAKEYGFEFTAQDFLDYTEEAKAKVGLTAEDLAEVSGGKGGVRAALMGTLALFGVAAAPAAMDMVSGGEVSPFSMVASAAEVDDQKLEYVRHGLTVLKEDISKYGSDDDKCYEYAKDIDSLLTQIDDFYLPNSVVSLDSLLTNVNTLATNITRDITSRWWKLKFKLDNLEQLVSERKNFLDENKYKTQITELRMRMQTLSSSDLSLVESAFRDISFDVEEFSADVVIKNSNQAKDRLATDISEKITSLKEKNNPTTNDAIGDLERLKSRLETEVKDLTPENVLDKEKIVKEVKNEFGEISKKIENAITLNFDIQRRKPELSNQLVLIKKQGEVQKRTDRPDDAQKINDIEQRINELDKGITYNTVEEKTKELEKLQLEVAALRQGILDFEKTYLRT